MSESSKIRKVSFFTIMLQNPLVPCLLTWWQRWISDSMKVEAYDKPKGDD